MQTNIKIGTATVPLDRDRYQPSYAEIQELPLIFHVSGRTHSVESKEICKIFLSESSLHVCTLMIKNKTCVVCVISQASLDTALLFKYVCKQLVPDGSTNLTLYADVNHSCLDVH